MTLLFVATAVLLLVAWAWFSRRRFLGWKKRPLGEPGRPAQDGDDFEDFNDKFLRNLGGKEGAVDLVRAAPDDVMLLRSLLDTEGVETFVQPSSLGDLYPTVATVGLKDAIVTIYREDLDLGRRVVEDFLSGWEASPDATPPTKPELLAPRE